MSDNHRIIDAITAMSSDLDLDTVLHRIVSVARELTDAQYGALGIIGKDGDGASFILSDFISEGMGDLDATHLNQPPQGLGILGAVIREKRVIRIADLQKDPRSAGFPEGHPSMHSFLGVPITIRGEIFGNVYLAEKRSGPFTKEDEEFITGLASAAAVTIENARLHRRVRALAVFKDRERIARDLHDTVIQRLFATGLTLQALARTVRDVEVRDRIQQSVDDLDDTIKEVRSVIFALQAHERGDHSTRIKLLTLINDYGDTLGFEPHVHFDGPVDTAINEELGEELYAVTTELLSNTTRHAKASTLDVFLTINASITLTIIDNGIGYNQTHHKGNGLKNLTQRATARGGNFTMAIGESGGTIASWSVPRESV